MARDVSGVFAPAVHVQSTSACDALVRRTAADDDAPAHLRALLTARLRHRSVRFVSPGDAEAQSWAAALSRLERSLSAAQDARSLVAGYLREMEACTAATTLDHLNAPLLRVAAAWVCEPALGDAVKKATPACDAPLHVVLVARDGVRQDMGAREAAVTEIAIPNATTHTLRLGDSAAEVDLVTALVRAARSELATRTDNCIAEHAKLRRAARSFSAWFRAPATAPTVPSQTPPGLNEALHAPQVEPQSPRKAAFGGDRHTTPQFELGSYEAVTRQLADLHVQATRHAEAVDLYRSLAADFRVMTGPARVHEAAALEMAALAPALARRALSLEDARGVDAAASAYVSSDRPELAVRAALRWAQLCDAASAHREACAVLIRASIAVASAPKSAAPASFVDGAAGVLHVAAALSLEASSRERRAALHSFLAAARFNKIAAQSAAATAVRLVHDSAYLWPGVREERDIVVGVAELSDGAPEVALRNFANVLSAANEHSDVEVQSLVVRQMSTAVRKGGVKALGNSWDAGVPFPPIDQEGTLVWTVDQGVDTPTDSVCAAQHAALEDWDYFRKVTQAVSSGEDMPRRERPLEERIGELRRLAGGDKDFGGSLENKIRRMREVEDERRQRRREESLLSGWAVVGEKVRVDFVLRNPLHFPVFVNDFAPVVNLDGTIYTRRHDDDEEDGANGVANGKQHGADPVRFMKVDEVLLGPRSAQCISAFIEIADTGTLRVMGAQWKFTVGMGDNRTRLASQVPGCASARRNGPRLNRTRAQRASTRPLYAEDASLRLRVTAPAPRVAVRIAGWTEHEFWRDGEMRQMHIEFANEGATEADGITVRIETPDALALAIDHAELGAFALDAAGSILEPHNPAPVVAAYLPIQVASGERTRRALWVRARATDEPKSRRSKAVELAPCECAVSVAYGSQRARVARWQGFMRVRNSIFISRRFLSRAEHNVLPPLPPHRQHEQRIGFVIGVEVEYAAQGQLLQGETSEAELVYEVTQLSAMSGRGWVCAPVPPTTQLKHPDRLALVNKQALLRTNETATLFGVLHPAADAAPHIPWTSSEVRLSDDESTPKSFARATSHFLLACQRPTAKGDWRSCALVAVAWRSTAGRQGMLLLPPVDVLRYAAAASAARPGSALATRSSSFASIPGTGAASAPSVADPLERHASHDELLADGMLAEGPPIRVELRHPLRVEHNFECGARPAVLPVDVHVRNCSPRLIDVTVAAAPHDQIADAARGRYWAGDISLSLRALPPDAERFLQLTAVIAEPGVYDMAAIAVKYQIALLKQSQRKAPVHLEPSYVEVVDAPDSSAALPDVAELAGDAITTHRPD